MALGGQPDRFLGAEIKGRPELFDAGQYSFFGDSDVGNGTALDGALEEGLEAPPDEDGLFGALEDDGLGEIEPDLLMDVGDEDLSLATMLRNHANVGEGPDLPDDDDLLASSLPKSFLADLDEALEPVRPASSASAGMRAPSAPSTPAAGGHLMQLLQKQSNASSATSRPVMTAEELEAQMLRRAEEAATAGVQQRQQPAGKSLTSPQSVPSGLPHPQHLPPPHHHMPPGFPGAPQMPPTPAPFQPPGMPMGPPGLPFPPGIMGPPAPGMRPVRMPPPGMAPGMRPPFPPQGPGMLPGFPPPPFGPHMPPGVFHQQPGPRGPSPHGHRPPAGPWGGRGPPGFFPGGPQGHPPAGDPLQNIAPHHRQALLAHEQHLMSVYQSHGQGNAGGAGGHGMSGGAHDSLRRAQYSGVYMDSNEVDQIMHIMYAAVHSGIPYIEDYYYQAFVNRHGKGRNAAAFQPEALRELNAGIAKLDPSASVKFVEVDGLGKIVLSNIRTPKVLMDLTAPMEPQAAPGPQESDGGAGSSQGEGGPPAAQVPVRPLEQEPRLAARIMLEDCMALLLDVDDIDRCFAAAAARGGLPVDADGLRTRRALLAAGITSSFNLPPAPQGTTSPQQADGQGSATGDGVFLRVLMLPKGRTMLARALRVLLASPPTPNGTTQHHHQPKAGGLDSSGMPEVAGGAHHPQLLLWALLRNAHNVFGSAGLVAGDTARQIELVDATHRLAAAARDGITKLATPAALLSALQAYVAGLQAHSSSAAGCVASPADALLPYASTRTGSSSSATTSGSGQAPVSTPSSSSAAASLNTAVPPDWLGEVVAALIQRGDQVGMEDAPGKVQQAWSDAVQHVVSSHERHLEALSVIHSAAHSAGNKEALGLVRSLTCRPLAQALMGHVSESQRGRLRELMLGFLT